VRVRTKGTVYANSMQINAHASIDLTTRARKDTGVHSSNETNNVNNMLDNSHGMSVC
jgi:hypothetical protein